MRVRRITLIKQVTVIYIIIKENRFNINHIINPFLRFKFYENVSYCQKIDN